MSRNIVSRRWKLEVDGKAILYFKDLTLARQHEKAARGKGHHTFIGECRVIR